MGKYSKTTGLTPQQEKAAVLLASGNTITETAKKLNVIRSTVYEWAEKANFKAYYNSLIKDIRERSENALFGMIDEAHKAIRESLKSKNESVKLKAALSIIDRVKTVEIGETDPIKLIKQQCTYHSSFNIDFGDTEFDERRFEKLMQENNLESG